MSTATAATGRTLTVRGRSYPVILPRITDPRLHLAAVIVSLQVLGQTVLEFDLSIAQILLSIGTCAVIEVWLTFFQQRIVMWPASAMLTGNGVAFILRVPGTEHGDWWSMNGWRIYVAVAALSLLTKYVIRYRGRHVFNPSNIGLVLAFLILGPAFADPQDLWWGPMSWWLALTLTIIVTGGLLIVTRLRMLGVALGFFLTFAAGVGVLAAYGHCMSARWSVTPVCGPSYWNVLVLSPEILVFLFFMITDPRTTPIGTVARAAHGVGVGVLASLMVAAHTTEFATKVSVLASLAVLCALRPLTERLMPAPFSEDDSLRGRSARVVGGGAPPGVRPRPARVAGVAGVAATVVVAFAAMLVGLGTGARTPEDVAGADTLDQSVVAGRPEVRLRPDQVPSVAIDDQVRRFSAAVDDATARHMAHDLVADLHIEAQARATADGDLAATALTGRRLESFRQDPSPRQAEPPDIDAVTVVVVRDESNPQAIPVIGLAARGVDQVGQAFEATYLMARVGDRYLIEDEEP